MQNENGNSKKITRFYRNLYEYETLAIYELSPDNYDLNDISFVTEFFKKSSEKAIYKDFWHKEYQSIDGEYGHWKLEPGKIYYLGSFTFYFKTKRLLYGLMNKFELNKEVKFLGLKIDNQFNQVKKQLLDTKTWFPADGIIDLSGPLKWYHKKDELDLTEFNKTKDKALVETEKVFY